MPPPKVDGAVNGRFWGHEVEKGVGAGRRASECCGRDRKRWERQGHRWRESELTWAEAS